MDPSSDIIINRDIYGMEPVFLDTLKSKGLKCIDLTDTLNFMKQNGTDPNFWKATKKMGHWNHEAHRAVGEYIAKELIRRGVVE